MHRFIDACLSSPSYALQEQTLERILPNATAHARFLNTLARLEYVGVRKMLKVRRAESLDLEGLQHVLEEAVHAVRLKKFAHAVAPNVGLVETFANRHTLAGDDAERYFQAIDHAASTKLSGVDPQVCYWLTSTAIEIRAKAFYPLYQRMLKSGEYKVSVASIVQDEEGHLEHMAGELPKYLPTWREVLGAVMQVEEENFVTFLRCVNRELDASKVYRAGAA